MLVLYVYVVFVNCIKNYFRCLSLMHMAYITISYVNTSLLLTLLIYQLNKCSSPLMTIWMASAVPQAAEMLVFFFAELTASCCAAVTVPSSRSESWTALHSAGHVVTSRHPVTSLTLLVHVRSRADGTGSQWETGTPIFTLRASEAVAQFIVIDPVCVFVGMFVCLWVCLFVDLLSR